MKKKNEKSFHKNNTCKNLGSFKKMKGNDPLYQNNKTLLKKKNQGVKNRVQGR